MKTILKVLIPVTWIATMATTCEYIPCECDTVVNKQSLAAGWCTLTIEDCEGNTQEIAVDEIVYNSYNVGDCYE